MILACFNILHYKAHEETINCVDSLLKLDGIEKCVIIIYDNGSKDGSDKILRDKYAGIKNVKVCVNPDADGFSRGNAAGGPSVLWKGKPRESRRDVHRGWTDRACFHIQDRYQGLSVELPESHPHRKLSWLIP